MTEQRPLGSGFGLHTTADEVLAGIDLTGRTALVTGGYSGIGIEMVRSLVRAGASVLVPARRPELAAEALAANLKEQGPRVTLGELDLADQASVAAYAEEVLAAGQHLDIVINSAGVMATPEAHVGPGWELQLATNHLGHFALVNRLWPLLDGGARVVSVSSGGHQFGGIRWDDLDFARDGYDKWLAYGQSKTANVLFAVELDRLGQQHGVRAFALHPGAILTPLGRHLRAEDMEALLSYGSDGEPLMPEFKSPEAGAATAVWAATSPMLEGHGGVYLEDCDVTPMAPEGERVTGQALGVMPHATDPDEARRLWAWSAEQTGVDAFG